MAASEEAKREEDWHTGSECSGGRFGMINNVTAEGDGGDGDAVAQGQNNNTEEGRDEEEVREREKVRAAAFLLLPRRQR